MLRGIIRTLSCRRLWRFITSHETDIWSFVVGMSITPIPTPFLPEHHPQLSDASGEPGSGTIPAFANENGCSPPPGHPEFLVPHLAPTPVERVLWAQLNEKLNP